MYLTIPFFVEGCYNEGWENDDKFLTDTEQ